MNGPHSVYFLQSAKIKNRLNSNNLALNILDWEKETILKSVVYDARNSDHSRLSDLIKSASISAYNLPCSGQILGKQALEIIRKLFFKLLQAAP